MICRLWEKAEVQQAVNQVVQQLDETLRMCLSAEPFIITEFEKRKHPTS
jgi:hypothetical protein